MAIERCDKCGKAFMSQSDVERHKRYEHPVPVSPFEERRFDSDLRKNNNNSSNMNVEDLQKMTSNVTTGRNNSNNDITTFGSRQVKKVPFRSFRF